MGASAGAAAPAIVAFIVAAQSAGIDSFFFTVGVLGSGAALARMVAAAVAATAAGLAVPSSKGISSQHVETSDADQRSFAAHMLDGLREAVTTSSDEVAPSVVLGFIITSGLVAALPPGGLALAAGLGGFKGRAAVLFLAMPLQFCEHAAVPLAAALQKAGATGGLAFSVLATLPGMNASSLGVVASVAGAVGAARVAAALWLSGVLGSFV